MYHLMNVREYVRARKQYIQNRLPGASNDHQALWIMFRGWLDDIEKLIAAEDAKEGESPPKSSKEAK